MKQDSEPSGQSPLVVPTAAVFAAVLERLNRQSTIDLFQQLTKEIDAHCQSLVAVVDRVQGADNRAAHERNGRQGGVFLLMLLVLLIGCLAFLVGWLWGQRRAMPICPPCPSAICCNTDVPTQKMRQGTNGPSVSKSGMAAGIRAEAKVGDKPAASPTKDGAGRSPDGGAGATTFPEQTAPEVSGANGRSTAGRTVKPIPFETELSNFLSKPGELPRTFTMDRLKYPANSHEMNAEGKDQVYELSRILAEYPTAHIEIRGHSDGAETETYTGPDPYQNYSLSQLRANCVLQRLHYLRVSSDRMQLRGMASSMPVASDSTAEGRQANRRVEVVVTRR